MKILITGAAGFVAGHYLHYLSSINDDYDVLCVDKNAPKTHIADQMDKLSGVRFSSLNLLESEDVYDMIREFKPDHVLHLAAFSSVAYSWKMPTESFLNNTVIFLNLMEALRKEVPDCRILSVGSSEEYGTVAIEDLPIRENQVLNPLSPYAVARVSQEQLSRIFADSFKMNIILTRSFNHIGPGQDTRFVIPSFIHRVMDLKKAGLKEGEIETGDITIIRDFVDVRDVVRAYHSLLLGGKPGEAYNICSGRRTSLADILETIAKIVGVKVKARVNPDFLRPQDSLETVGTYYKMESAFGWRPEIPLERTIRDMVEWECDHNG